MKFTRIRIINKIINNAIAFTLAMAFFMLPSLQLIAHAEAQYLVNTVDHTDLSYGEFKYAEVSLDKFVKKGDKLKSLVKEKGNKDEIFNIIADLEKMYSDADANFALAELDSYKNTNNKELTDIQEKYHSELIDLNDKLFEYYSIVASSIYGDDLASYIGNDDLFDEIENYVPLTDEQKELIEKENELVNKYNELYDTKCETKINGKSYDEESLEKAYKDGIIEVTDYFEGMSNLTLMRNKILGDVFLELVDVRTKYARSYGYDNYNEYAEENILCGDYTQEDLDPYRESVKKYFAPFMKEIYNYYFDNYSDIEETITEKKMSKEECLDIFSSQFEYISTDLQEPFNYMVEKDLCDLNVDENKAPNTFTICIAGEYKTPYIQLDAKGTYNDLFDLVHEFGHFNQEYYAPERDYFLSLNNLDLAEIHSQGLEAIYQIRYRDIFTEEEANAINAYSEVNNIYAVIQGLKENDFQRLVYENPDKLTLEKVNQYYYEVCNEYQDLDLFYASYYLGLYGYNPSDEIYEWVEVPHTFQQPFYYISYSLSMVAVYELKEELNRDYDMGIEKYFKLVEMGCEDSYVDTIEKVGINNPIANPRFDIYSDIVRKEIGMEPIYEDEDSISDSDSDDVTKDFETGQIDDEDEKHHGRTDSDKITMEKKSGDNETDSREFALYVILAGLLVVLAIIICIIIVIIRNQRLEKEIREKEINTNKEE